MSGSELLSATSSPVFRLFPSDIYCQIAAVGAKLPPIMSKNLSTISILFVLLFSVDGVLGQSDDNAYPFIFDRPLISKPDVRTPQEATESGLGGTVSVPVTVDASGNVVSVGKASGPGAVCTRVDRADVVAMRAAAEKAARLVRFEPINNGESTLARSWVKFEFLASDKEEAVSVSDYKGPVNTASNADQKPAGDKNKYTVKGDANYSAANSPPPDYVGPVNTAGQTKDGTDKGEKFTVKGDMNYSPALTPADGGKKLSGGVLNGKATLLPRPPYPPAARAVRASGAVSIQVLIDTNGEVFSAQAVSGHPLLRSASAIAACGARFTPILLEGQPVKVSGIITYNFVP